MIQTPLLLAFKTLIILFMLEISSPTLQFHDDTMSGASQRHHRRGSDSREDSITLDRDSMLDDDDSDDNLISMQNGLSANRYNFEETPKDASELFLEQMDSVVATMIQGAMDDDSSTETTSLDSAAEETREKMQQESQKLAAERSVSVTDDNRLEQHSKFVPIDQDVTEEQPPTFELNNRESTELSINTRKASASPINTMTEVSVNPESIFENVVRDDYEARNGLAVEPTSPGSTRHVSETSESTTNEGPVEFREEATSPGSTEDAEIAIQETFSDFNPSTKETTYSTSADKVFSDRSKHRASRLTRKEPAIIIIKKNNTKIEMKKWKSEIESIHLNSTTESSSSEPTEHPEKACDIESITCEECKAVSPYCHYNFTGKFCFYSNVSHRNDVYECGVRFVIADSYSPVMMTVVVLALASVGVAAYFVRVILQKKMSAALPREELDEMREQVQFVRDRRTNK